MRTIAQGLLFVNIVSLVVLAAIYSDPTQLGLCMAVLACCLALTMFTGARPVLASAVVATVLSFFAGYSFASEKLWLDGALAVGIGLLPALSVIVLFVWSWKHTTRVWPSEILVLNNPLLGGLRAVPGPNRILLHPMATILARLPRTVHEFHLDLEQVNAMPRAGPYGLIAQDIRLMRVELVFRLQPGGYRKIFAITNQGEIFKAAAAAVGRTMPAAMQERAFWSHVWRLALTQITEQVVRDEVHASGLAPLQVSQQRTALAERIFERVAEEIEPLELELLECTIQKVEPDETEASLRSRESLLLAQSRATELEMTGERIAALMQRLAEVSRSSKGAIPTELLETLVMSVLAPATPRVHTHLRSPHDTHWLDEHRFGDDHQPRPKGTGERYRN